MLKGKKKAKNIAEAIKDKYTLAVNKSLGIIRLGTDIRDILPNFDYVIFRKNPDNKSDWDRYKLKGYKNISIYTDDSYIINSIITETYCFYKGVNLIGLNINAFMELFGVNKPDNSDIIFLTNGGNQHVFDFDSIGLQIWFKYNKIKTIII